MTTGAVYGISGLCSTELLGRGFDSFALTVVRSVVAVVILAAIALVFHRDAFRIRRRDLLQVAALGVSGNLFFQIFFFASLERSPVAVSVALLYIAPPVAGALAWALLGEAMSRYEVAALILTTFGVVLISGVFSSSALSATKQAGLLFGVAAGLSGAVMTVWSRRLLRTIPISALLIWSSAAGAAVILAIELITAHSLDGAPALRLSTLVLLASIVILPNVIGRFLGTWTLAELGAASAGVLGSVEPVAAIVGGLLLFDQVPGGGELAGITIVVLGALLVRLDIRRDPTGTPAPR